MTSSSSQTRPLVRYHGGKWRLAPWIISHFPPHRVYTELFGGGASVLLVKERSYAEVYNDLDSSIVGLFTVMRDRADDLRALCELTPFSREEFTKAYVPCWDDPEYKGTADQMPVEQARRVLVRSHMGFGSNAISRKSTGFRNNVTRGGGIPCHLWSRLTQHFDLIRNRLAGVIIENRCAFDLLKKFDGPDTLHYIDPPYPKQTRSDLFDDYKHELTDAQHAELWDVVGQLRGNVVLSGYDCKLYAERSALLGFTKVEKLARIDSGRIATECLWLCPKTVEALAGPVQGVLI